MKINKIKVSKTIVSLSYRDMLKKHRDYLSQGRTMTEIIDYVKFNYPFGFKPSVKNKFKKADEIIYDGGCGWGFWFKGGPKLAEREK